MLIRTPHSAVTVTAALLLGSLVLGGCSTGSNVTVTHTAALDTVGGRQTVRSGVQTAILSAGTLNGLALPGGPTPASIARRVSAIVHGRSTSATGGSTGACSNGVKQSQVTNADGSRTTTTDYYYETTCATLEAEEIIIVTKPGNPNTDGSGTIVSYDRAGNVRVSIKLSIAIATTAATSTVPAQETITVTEAASKTVGGTAITAVGATCVGAPNAVTMNCSLAHAGTSNSSTFGEAVGDVATAGTPNSATVNAALYSASGLTIGSTGATWGVSGATAFNSLTGTYTYTSTGPSGSGTMSLKDSLYTFVETATLSSTGLSVTIVENPNGIITTTIPIATATVDVAGTGVLTFADNVTEPIAGGLLGF